MENVIGELAEMVARAEVDAVESILDHVQPGEQVLAELDLQGRAIYAAQEVARLSLQAYIKNLGAWRTDGVFILSKATTPEQMAHVDLMGKRYNLLYSLFKYLLARMLPSPNLTQKVLVRRGYKLVVAPEDKSSALLGAAEQAAQKEDLKPQ